MKRFLTVCLTFMLLAAMGVTACAAPSSSGFSDVAAEAWYAGAVDYVQSNGLMSGTSATTFAPDSTMTRAMVATVLYHIAGSPAVTGTDNFTDTADGAWYSDAVLWSSQQGLMGGYGGGLFGTSDPVTREQLATILWHYAGSPAAGSSADFADEDFISPYAASAVDWARASGVIGGLPGNLFSPRSSATRAQVAVILHGYMQMEPSYTPDDTPSSSHVLVAYFSATGNTETAAEYIAEALDAGLYEIVPEEPYTSSDLNWNDPDSRVNDEHKNPDFRPAIAGGTADLTGYDTIFLGYPIWWGEAPNILRTFLESNDLSGKTVIPFCTSSSSGLGSSAENLQIFAPNAVWLEGQRFSSRVSQSDVEAWVSGLNLNI